jgi:predicted RNA-binding protein with RPS1 domain
MSSTESFEDLLKQFDRAHPGTRQGEPKVGDRVQGTLVSIGEDFAFVDLGGKTEGRMEIAALRNAEGELTAAVGDSVEAAVTGKDADSGTLLLGSQHGHMAPTVALQAFQHATQQTTASHRQHHHVGHPTGGDCGLGHLVHQRTVALPQQRVVKGMNEGVGGTQHALRQLVGVLPRRAVHCELCALEFNQLAGAG